MQEEIADYGEDDNAELYGDTEISGDADIDEMKRRVEEMENENSKLNQMQQSVDKQLTNASDSIDENSM